VPGESAFRWSSVARAAARRWVTDARFDFFEGSHDGFLRLDPPAEYARAVLFLKGDYWVVLDRVRTHGEEPLRGKGGARRCEAHFHFAADFDPSFDTRGRECVVAAGGGGATGFEILSPRDDGEWSRGEAWVSRCYGSRERAAVFTRRLDFKGARDSFAFLLPRAAGVRGEARLSELRAEGGRAFELQQEGARDLLLVRGEGAREARAARVESECEWAWLRFSPTADTLEEFVVVGGGGLRVDGRDVVDAAARGGHVEHLAARREGGRWVARGGEDLFAREPEALEEGAARDGRGVAGGEVASGSLVSVED
jgi:hypothetical protein